MFDWGSLHTLHLRMQRNKFELGFPVQTGDQVDYFIEYIIQRRKHALKAVFANTDNTSDTVGVGECSTFLLNYLDGRVMELDWGSQHTLHLRMQRSKFELGFPVQTGDQVDYFIVYSIQRRKHALKAVFANTDNTSGTVGVGECSTFLLNHLDGRVMELDWGSQHTLHLRMQRNKFELGFPVQTGDQVDYFIEYSIQRRKHALKAVFANTDNTSGTVGVGECSTFLLNYLDGRVMELDWGSQHTLHLRMQRNKFELGFPVQTGDQVDYFIEYSIQRRKHALKAVFANTDNTSGTVGVGECSTFLLNHLDGRVMELDWGSQHTLHLRMQRNKFELGFPVQTGDQVDYFIEYSIQRRKHALKVVFANTDNTSGTVGVGECSTFLLNYLDGRVMVLRLGLAAHSTLEDATEQV